MLTSPRATHRPQLHTTGTSAHAGGPAATTAGLYEKALANVLDINTVPGRGAGEPPRFIRAGGEYADPWTRDAAINSWAVASTVAPDIARDTLIMVCGKQDAHRVIAQDNQWWDQIIWVIAAWQHVLITGDHEFLEEAYGIGVRSAAILHENRYRTDVGLYVGGAVMQDGISGYPSPPNDPAIDSSFVLDYPLALDIMCLSTNAVYVDAYRSLAAMAAALGVDGTIYAQRSASVADAMNRHLWMADSETYGYFAAGDDAHTLTVDDHQEALGLAFAARFGIADQARARRVLAAAHREPRGIPNVWPEFQDRYDATHPGRHSVSCWPMVMGFFAEAEAQCGMVDAFARSLGELTSLVAATDGSFFEVYNAQSGAVDGGWQQGHAWPSLPDQTWSASALIRAVHTGLFGLRYEERGLRFAPTVPDAFDGVALRGLPYRDAVLDVRLDGHGSTLQTVRVDGHEVDGHDTVIDAALRGRHEVTLEIR
jgi:glycogen debranching enzyme